MLSSVFLFFSFSGSEIMLILFVALILFGGDKFPEIARGLGKGIREFKDMSDGVKREIHTQINNYDVEPKRTDTTPAAQVEDVSQAPEVSVYDHSADFHQNHDIAVVSHDEHVATTPVRHDEPVASMPAAPVEQVTEQTEKPKIDLSKPPNTISHQSY